MKNIIVVGLLTILTASVLAGDFHVAPNGNDNNPGTAESPLATLEAARDAVRTLRAGEADKTLRHTVVLHGGVYRRDRTFELDERDSYTTYKAHNAAAVRLQGGIEIPKGIAKPVTDPAVLGRIVEEAARPHLHMIDLKALGITDYGKLGPRGFRRAYIPAPLELFIDGKPMQIARWPNVDEPDIPLSKALDRGSSPRWKGDYLCRPATFPYGVDRPRHWAQAKGFYVSGIFNFSWADDTIEVAKLDLDQGTFTTTDPHIYGFTYGPKTYNKWHALNLLEEIDQPGEYFVDAGTGRLYFYPPVGFGSDSTLAVSMLEQPLVAIEGATGIELDGLILEKSRGSGVYIERGAENVLRGCTLRNLGILAVQVGKGVEPFPEGKHDGAGNKEDGQPGKPVSREMGSWHEHIYKFTDYNREAGTGHRIIGCDIHDIGAGGISLGGGDRETLTPGNNAVINCNIYRVNRFDRTYKTMVNIDGVGNRIAHCQMHDAPGGAIYLHGNDHIIEYNKIGNVLTDTSDMGAFYMGRDPSEVGSVIRHNYFHDIKNNLGGVGTFAIYFDDWSICGADVLANVFYRAGTGSSCVINFNKGGSVPIEDNILIDCPRVIGGNLGNSTEHVRKFVQTPLGIERVRERVGITRPPYSEKYPHLLAIYEQKAPVETNPVRNIVTTVSDPRFVDGANEDFTLRPNAELPEGFQRFDFNKIGLYIGDGREVLPVKSPNLEAGVSTRFRGATRVAFVMPKHADGIVYTLDGQMPTLSSTRYAGPFEIKNAVTVTACGVGKGNSPTLSHPTVVTFSPIEATPVREARINFQPTGGPKPEGYILDEGATFRQQNGAAYGWSEENSKSARRRGKSRDPLRDTMVHFSDNNEWEIAVDNGNYDLTICIGDAQYACENQTLFAEGTIICEGLNLAAGEFREITKRVTVQDGLLTLGSIDAPHGPSLTRMNYLHLKPAQ